MAAKRTSTIGYERRYNYALRIREREEFVRSLTSGMPAAPDHFARCSAVNRAGPALLRNLPEPVPFSPADFHDRTGEAVILDIRSYAAFAGLHVPGSWYIDPEGNFATNAGWVLPPGREILLVTDDPRQVKAAVVELRRVGFDRAAGYLDGGIHAWATEDLPSGRVPFLSPQEAHAGIAAGEAVLVDVREPEEWNAGHAEDSIHIPWHDLRTRYTELDPARHFIVMCKGGQRASTAAGILKMQGFRSVSNLAGGYLAYRRAGYAP